MLYDDDFYLLQLSMVCVGGEEVYICSEGSVVVNGNLKLSSNSDQYDDFRV